MEFLNLFPPTTDTQYIGKIYCSPVQLKHTGPYSLYTVQSRLIYVYKGSLAIRHCCICVSHVKTELCLQASHLFQCERG